MTASMKKSAGFTLIASLFLLVVLAVLAAFMVKLSTGLHIGSSMSVQSLRANFAAASALEWVAYDIELNNTCPAVGSLFSIEGFQISLNSCTSESITEASTSYDVYDINLTASRGNFGDTDYVRRRLQASLIQ